MIEISIIKHISGSSSPNDAYLIANIQKWWDPSTVRLPKTETLIHPTNICWLKNRILTLGPTIVVNKYVNKKRSFGNGKSVQSNNSLSTLLSKTIYINVVNGNKFVWEGQWEVQVSKISTNNGGLKTGRFKLDRMDSNSLNHGRTTESNQSLDVLKTLLIIPFSCTRVQ